jgi:hypothetical protein
MVSEYAASLAQPLTETISKKVYEDTYPEWCQMVKRSALFILSKHEMRPIQATIKNVTERLSYSPDWVMHCLLKAEEKKSKDNFEN